MGCHLSLVQCQQEGEGWQAVAGALGGAGRGAGGGEPALQYIIYTYIYIYIYMYAWCIYICVYIYTYMYPLLLIQFNIYDYIFRNTIKYLFFVNNILLHIINQNEHIYIYIYICIYNYIEIKKGTNLHNHHSPRRMMYHIYHLQLYLMSNLIYLNDP